MTRRQQLISQLRSALYAVEKPSYHNNDECACFTIGEIEFEFDPDSLMMEVE